MHKTLKTIKTQLMNVVLKSIEQNTKSMYENHLKVSCQWSL